MDDEVTTQNRLEPSGQPFFAHLIIVRGILIFPHVVSFSFTIFLLEPNPTFMMTWILPFLLALLLPSACAWNADMLQTMAARSHYMPNIPNILKHFETILKEGKLPTDKFEYRKGERFTDREVRNLSEFISVYVSEEHNVILPGGTNLPKFTMPGQMRSQDNKTAYLVAIMEPLAYDLSDIVIEYSMLNVHNMASSGYYDPAYLAKLVYIPALPFENKLFFVKDNREHDVIVTFFYTNKHGDRRTEIVDAIKNKGVDITYHHFTTLDGLQTLYDSSKILVNVHQTYWHHTLEELRILPALQRGVIVVSEWVPNAEVIPFHEFIIFAPYERLAAVAADVHKRYDHYYEQIYGNSSKLPDLLASMQFKGYSDLAHRVRAVLPKDWNALASSHSTVKYSKTFRLAVQGSTRSVFKVENGTYCEFASADQFARDGFIFWEQSHVPDSFFQSFVNIGVCV